ncbi:hypothetical protein BC829DRAFT_380904 [Chytridium lagenaria]|nr:hypothetical protein BC829DRAFT_380904 [Chytridium lagenaria]
MSYMSQQTSNIKPEFKLCYRTRDLPNTITPLPGSPNPRYATAKPRIDSGLTLTSTGKSILRPSSALDSTRFMIVKASSEPSKDKKAFTSVLQRLDSSLDKSVISETEERRRRRGSSFGSRSLDSIPEEQTPTHDTAGVEGRNLLSTLTSPSPAVSDSISVDINQTSPELTNPTKLASPQPIPIHLIKRRYIDMTDLTGLATLALSHLTTLQTLHPHLTHLPAYLTTSTQIIHLGYSISQAYLPLAQTCTDARLRAHLSASISKCATAAERMKIIMGRSRSGDREGVVLNCAMAVVGAAEEAVVMEVVEAKKGENAFVMVLEEAVEVGDVEGNALIVDAAVEKMSIVAAASLA